MGAFEGVTVVEPRDERCGSPDDGAGWCARYCAGRETAWSAWSTCRLLDITLAGARVELAGHLPADPVAGLPFLLQIDSIADDEVGITMRAVVRAVEPRDDWLDGDRPVVDVEFSARREERMLLQLLVRLHALV